MTDNAYAVTRLRSLRGLRLCNALVAALVLHACFANAASVAPGTQPQNDAATTSSGAITQVALHVEPPAQASPVVPVPPSEQYPELYRDVELAHLFPDSKTFADMVPLEPPSQIAASYTSGKQQPGFNLGDFVKRNFALPARESKSYVSDPNQDVVSHIDTLWTVLRREPDSTASRWSSLLPLPDPYIVPGDRFDEIYYWDSYFIMLGLEASGRHAMVVDALKNFAALIDRYGHIPNGNRTYYLSRSQPPFFAQMVRLVADKDGDAVYAQYLPQLRREYAYWMNGSEGLAAGHASRHVVRLADGTLLNRYWDERAAPRDESYREDVASSQQTPQRNPEDLWRNLRAGGETGWDFSSRWFADGKTLATVDVTSLAPVDLNCLLVDLERALAKAYRMRGDVTHAENMAQRAATRADTIRRVLWDPQLQAFGDYDFVHRTLTHKLTAATVYPLYTGVASRQQAKAVAVTLQRELLRPGGLVTTRVASGQQWDAPNGWAPLQYLAVIGLRRYSEAALAQTIATRWIRTNVSYYQHTGKLVEKYDVEAAAPGVAAGGGEYPLQDGFGWTNGVLRTLLALYPQAVSSSRPSDIPAGPAGVAAAAASAAAAPKNTHRLQGMRVNP
ncbi:alpha,alpha-trehalase TreF [bacterium M00.F.Ca.ET.228.01.1.1]|uniref:alpha,alpha-trehalase TreF n=1 Tax=Paraburkholderia phenoliruptrix TaxID=252970 RepID=UPI0010932E0F|nr:alpha,alpha-trehalase TreF [Paraburkholderia phenoliruptrix]TGP46208.1 alpha,alpha-trehalase TreF [bacterium M00.F.Ca.ET.228.01.1.1]TGS03878.1 alpha,alpha-trehalase TreF [bacterium M00.F.Ca.ET.191.01.1.1]TGU07502.1 alpha,alpha-trehalase TreF [bacterium M00.F.Ca.ET.155.01.1.1]MBW0446389.1 alpha,alpha-trehalase TreF [Paraburkholderia phenoliruptrix]MBW9096812.1 alpha,alpha-trehalase TreF [Paraburkholderia phenoliruptrix]